MRPEDLRRRVAEKRAAAERKRSEVRGGSFSPDPIEAAFDPMALGEELHGARNATARTSTTGR